MQRPVVWSPAIKLVITRRHVKWCNRVDEVHGINHLQAVPEIALQRGIQEIATMQHMHVATLGL